jgi:hypothetical protein
MSKKNNNQQNSGNKIRIHNDAIQFAKASFKKFKKKWGDNYDSKKELKNAFYLYLIDRLPKAIEFVVRYGHIQNDEVKATKDGIYTHLVNEDFIKALKKELKAGTKIDSIKLLPIIIADIVSITDHNNAEALAADPKAKVYDMSDLVELSQIILKKKLKKFKKANINEKLAFDCLSVIPTDDVLTVSQNYRIRQLFDVLYEHARNETIPVSDLLKIIVGEEYYSVIVVFALLERKEKFGTLTEPQKNFYLAVSNWAFDVMEKKLSKDELTTVLNTYVRARRRDESNGKDGNRRYVLSTLSAEDYPRIAGKVNQMIANNDQLKKYL